MRKKQLNIQFTEVNSLGKFNEIDQRRINKAKSAAKTAYAPYSRFNVRTSLILKNGEIFTGSNQRNVSYPSSLCAEFQGYTHQHTPSTLLS